MVILTSVRAPIPGGQTVPVQPAADERSVDGRQQRPVSEPVTIHAIRQGAAIAGISGDALLMARTMSRDRAAVDAHAAREAYIKASIAAGVNPLPLSGV